MSFCIVPKNLSLMDKDIVLLEYACVIRKEILCWNNLVIHYLQVVS